MAGRASLITALRRRSEFVTSLESYNWSGHRDPAPVVFARPEWEMELSMRFQTFRLGIALAGGMVSANTQWLNFPAPGTPMTRDGKPNLSLRRRAPAMASRTFPESGRSSTTDWE